MILPRVNFDTEELVLQSFDAIANQFANNICLQINDAQYRIVDFEFYVYSDAFPDPHTHQNSLQLEAGRLYVHNSGVDITLGGGTNYAGILLRSIIKLYDGVGKESGFMEKQIEGPQAVSTELFSNIYSLEDNRANEIALRDLNDSDLGANLDPALRVLKTKRIGLTPKAEDKVSYYLNLPIRYITILPKYPNFKQSLKGIENIIGEYVKSGQIKDEEEIIKILGYKRNFG